DVVPWCVDLVGHSAPCAWTRIRNVRSVPIEPETVDRSHALFRGRASVARARRAAVVHHTAGRPAPLAIRERPSVPALTGAGSVAAAVGIRNIAVAVFVAARIAQTWELAAISGSRADRTAEGRATALEVGIPVRRELQVIADISLLVLA